MFNRPTQNALEVELQSELNQTWVVYGTRDRPEACGVQISRWLTKLRMVEEIKNFPSELQTHAFAQREILND